MGELPSNRPPPAASGTLAKTPFLHLLIYAFEKKLGGTIEVTAADGRVVSVLFVSGEPAKARVSEPVFYLGHVLVELGYITTDVLERSLAELEDMRATRPMLHGDFLVGKGLIDAVRLQAGLREQISRRLRYVASLPADAAYAYYDGFDALNGWGGEVSRGVDPLPMLWGLLRESAPRAHVDAALARVVGSSLRIAKTATLVRLGLGSEERAAIELLRVRPLPVADFARASALPEHEARLLMYLLLVTKQVDVISAGASRTIAPQRGSTPAPRVSVPPRTPVPSVSPRSPQTGTSGPPSSMSPPSSRTPVPPSPRTALARSLFPQGTGSRSKPPPGLAPELTERWATIVDRARTIDRSDYFTMLDLARDSTKEDANNSFFTLVKKWHPDRLPPELFPVKEACARVFARMSEAHATLTDDDKRGHYMRLHEGGSGSPEMQDAVAKVVEAAADFQKAEVCFKRNDLAQAESLVRKALKNDPTQADYHAMFAWLLSLKPQNQSNEKAVESIQMLDKAISMNDRCEKALFWRGMLNKRVGKPESAYRDFRKAVDLNPHNIDAAREVRLHNMRGGPRGQSSSPPANRRSSPLPAKPSKAEEKAGLLGRFFKK